nr:kirola-like [Tanacetum cinerariifolium]
MVAYLTQSDASEWFNQIIDFLNGSYIKYALTVSPNIYVSCVKQFWNTVVIKQVNDVTRLQALVDKKMSLAHQWRLLSFAYPQEGICKYKESRKRFFRVETPLFEGMLVEQEIKKEGDANEHVNEVTAADAAHRDDSDAYGEVSTVTQEPSIPSPTPPTLQPQLPQDVPSTSQVHQTPPQSPQVQPSSPQPQPQPQQAAEFLMSLLQEAIDACAALTRRVEHLEYDKLAQALEITKLKIRVKKLENRNKVRMLKLRRLQRVGTSQRVDTSDDTMMDDESNQGRIIAKMDKDDAVVLMDDKEEDKMIEEAKVDKIPAATLTNAPARVTAAPSKRRKGVVIRDPESESATSTIILAKTKSKDKCREILVEEPKPLKKKQHIEQDEQYARELHAKLIKDIDWDEAIDHVKRKAKEDPAVKIYHVLNRKPQTEAQARKNTIMYLKNVAGFKMDYLKGMSYDDIRLIFVAKLNSNVAFLLKTKEQIKEEENIALQKINETPAERPAKRTKLDEEVEDLKRHLEIVADEDDDVYTEATPLARKRGLGGFMKCTCLNLEESKNCRWSRKGQELEATGIMWKLLLGGAYIHICRDAKVMAQVVPLILQIITQEEIDRNTESSMVTWTVEYENLSKDVPDPDSLLEFAKNVIKYAETRLNPTLVIEAAQKVGNDIKIPQLQ